MPSSALKKGHPVPGGPRESRWPIYSLWPIHSLRPIRMLSCRRPDCLSRGGGRSHHIVAVQSLRGINVDHLNVLAYFYSTRPVSASAPSTFRSSGTPLAIRFLQALEVHTASSRVLGSLESRTIPSDCGWSESDRGPSAPARSTPPSLPPANLPPPGRQPRAMVQSPLPSDPLPSMPTRGGAGSSTD
jgi:hypothetical protein